MDIKPGRYRHYKGTEADVICVAKHTETKEEMVVYEHIEDETRQNAIWVRPLKMFLEMVIVNGKEVPRFEFIGS